MHFKREKIVTYFICDDSLNVKIIIISIQMEIEQKITDREGLFNFLKFNIFVCLFVRAIR